MRIVTVGIIKLLADVVFLPAFFLTTSFGARFSKSAQACKCRKHFRCAACMERDQLTKAKK